MAEETVDSRGRVTPEFAEEVRRTRVAEQWERYDSIVIGPGAKAVDTGWFNTWAEFGAASELVWFTKRDSAVGESYTNQSTERTDWAQDIYQTGIEFLAPTGLGDRERDVLDQVIMPNLFIRHLPTLMPFRVKLADADEIALAPGNHYPPGYGVTGTEASQAPAPLFVGGNVGEAHVSNTWKWPEPVMVPAQGRIAVRARIDEPIVTLLRQLTACPGFKQIPPCPLFPPGGSIPNPPIAYPNWYVIKVFHRGPRYLQLRGARSAA